MVHFVAILNFSSLSSHSSRKHRTMGNWGHGKLKRSKQRKCQTNKKFEREYDKEVVLCESEIRYTHQKSGDNVEVEGVRGGSMYWQTKG